MSKLKGARAYKQYWEDQAEFMDKEPWAKHKVVKIDFIPSYEEKLHELQFSNHSIDRDKGHLIVRLKVPYNYLVLEEFESRVLEILGIKKDWIINIRIDDAYCKSQRW